MLKFVKGYICGVILLITLCQSVFAQELPVPLVELDFSNFQSGKGSVTDKAGNLAVNAVRPYYELQTGAQRYDMTSQIWQSSNDNSKIPYLCYGGGVSGGLWFDLDVAEGAYKTPLYTDASAVTVETWAYLPKDADGWNTLFDLQDTTRQPPNYPCWAHGINDRLRMTFKRDYGIVIETGNAVGSTKFVRMGGEGKMMPLCNTLDWQHFVLTRKTQSDGNAELYLYVNGKLFDSAVVSGTKSDGWDLISVCSSDYKGDSPWKGGVATFKIFNQVLSESQVKQLYYASADDFRELDGIKLFFSGFSDKSGRPIEELEGETSAFLNNCRVENDSCNEAQLKITFLYHGVHAESREISSQLSVKPGENVSSGLIGLDELADEKDNMVTVTVTDMQSGMTLSTKILPYQKNSEVILNRIKIPAEKVMNPWMILPDQVKVVCADTRGKVNVTEVIYRPEENDIILTLDGKQNSEIYDVTIVGAKYTVATQIQQKEQPGKVRIRSVVKVSDGSVKLTLYNPNYSEEKIVLTGIDSNGKIFYNNSNLTIGPQQVIDCSVPSVNVAIETIKWKVMKY